MSATSTPTTPIANPSTTAAMTPRTCGPRSLTGGFSAGSRGSILTACMRGAGLTNANPTRMTINRRLAPGRSPTPDEVMRSCGVQLCLPDHSERDETTGRDAGQHGLTGLAGPCEHHEQLLLLGRRES